MTMHNTQKNRIKKLIENFHKTLENNHPNWKDCDTCASVMNNLLSLDLSDTNITYNLIEEKINNLKEELKTLIP